MRPRFALILLAALGCSSEQSPAPTDAAVTDTPTIDAPATDAPAVDAPTDTRLGDATASDGGASCGNAFGTRCNLVTNAGCSGGDGCYIVMGPTGLVAQCRPAGRAGWDEPCVSNGDCREGFVCMASGQCTKLCCNGDDTLCNDESHGGRAGAHCAANLTNGRGLMACVSDNGCDPFVTSNNRCPAGSPRCNPIGDTTTCEQQATGCAVAGEGAPCCETNCCQPGLLCVGSQSAAMCDAGTPGNRCRRACNLRSTAPNGGCGTGQRCAAFSAGSMLPSYYGYCVTAT